VPLASPWTGTGQTIGDLDAAILREIVAGGPDGLAERMAERLAAAGRTLQRDGTPVHDSAEQRALVETACDTFVAVTLPRLAALGIVVPRSEPAT
jgi:hypothetical protein